MGWTFTDELAQYAAAVEPLLRPDPVENTVPLTVIENSRRRPPADESYGWWTDPAGTVTGAISHTAPHPVLLGAVPENAIVPLVESGRLIGGISGETRLAAQCGAVWARSTGGTIEIQAAHRLYRLEGLRVPTAPDGHARQATDADQEFLLECQKGFGAETSTSRAHADLAAAVADRLSFGGLWIWIDGSGEPVAMAGHSRRAAGVIRVAPVFTPPDRRGRGYGSAVTAAISQHVQDSSTQVALFTDLTNPTSNSIYQKIGYRPVSDRMILTLKS